jgi:hypothetical protein
VFVSAGSHVQAGLGVARTRLVNSARSGLLRDASADAYGESGGSLARVGPARFLSKLVQVQFEELAGGDDSAVLAIRWQATGPGGGLFPALDADITLMAAGRDNCLLVITGVYRPPLGSIGAGLDRAVLYRVALATLQALATQLAAAISEPGTLPGRDGQELAADTASPGEPWATGTGGRAR